MRSRYLATVDLSSLVTPILIAGILTLSLNAQLPEPWTSQDVGSPALPGQAGPTPTGFVVDAAGTDISGSADQFHFVYQVLTGDGDIVARVDSLVQTHVLAKAGVMIRESLAADSRHGFAFVAAGQGAGFLRRTTTGGSSAAIRGDRAQTPYWVRLVRSGTTLEAYQAADGIGWTLIGRETLALPERVYIGLAVTSRDAGALTRAIFSEVAVRGSDLPNRPPATSITAPASGATFTAPATIAVTAAAQDPDGSIASVEFYAGSTLLGTSTASPYSITWNAVAAGTYSLTAVAIDNAGATTASAPVTVTVVSNQPPVVSLTSPAPDSTVAAPAAVNVAAAAADPDGTVARVEFYAGSTLLGSDTTSPYALAWDVRSPGTYTITAVAVDNLGARAASPAITLTAVPSHAVFTASVDHDALVTSYRLEIFVSGADPDTATPVAVQELGKPEPVSGEITVDITTTLQPLAGGNYVATVTAVAPGTASRSAPAALVR